MFQVTARPVVDCILDGEHFRFAIEDLVVPVRLNEDDTFVPHQATRFTLAFRPEIGVEQCRDIEGTLSKLGATTLLFLDHIEQVRWRCEERSGECNRTATEGSVVTLTQRNVEAGECKQEYLMFDREVGIESSDRPSQSVRLAFRLDDQKRIIPEEMGTPLHVFFETEERTGLPFRLHGPFLLTDNRANIKRKEPVNDRLI